MPSLAKRIRINHYPIYEFTNGQTIERIHIRSTTALKCMKIRLANRIQILSQSSHYEPHKYTSLWVGIIN
jgi:hypothetical protein